MNLGCNVYGYIILEKNTCTIHFWTGYGKTSPFIAAHEFVFRGATDEKSDFLLHFLQELNIDKYESCSQ